MFATQTNKKAKAVAEGKPHQADAAAGKDSPEPNPVWQSLALNPLSIQRKLAISQPDDPYEREADHTAALVMRMPESLSTPACESSKRQNEQTTGDYLATKPRRASDSVETAVAPGLREASVSSGEPLDQTTRAFMEPRFGYDFSHVRTYTNGEAARACGNLNAKAFTHNQHIYFGAGRSPGNDALTAHELTHVVQQTSTQQPGLSPSVDIRTNPGQRPSIQRKLELRPPGKGEASAFARAQEFVDRLNTVSPAIKYELKGHSLVYTVKDEAALTHFDTVMKGFIDRVDLVPMRLITSKGYVGGGPLFADSFINAYVDLDDLLADDIYSFQSDLLHFLTERFQVKDYARLIGTDFTAQFNKSHQAGKDAEAAQLQDLFNDPSIVFNYVQEEANKPWVNAFKSKDHGYRVFQVVRHSEHEVAGGKMWVQKKDGTRMSIDDFRKERAAAPK